ncbi:hypothetical protein [Coxiella-like endosymbiont]|nr:hypothetical protein [Coxiella-like endosymbiont]
MRYLHINPVKEMASHISPEILHRWYQENRDIVILDTRSDFEVTMGNPH